MGSTLQTAEPGTDLYLKPCPFCGCKTIFYEKYVPPEIGEQRWRVWCMDCLATIDPGWATQRVDVCEMWNRRYNDEEDIV